MELPEIAQKSVEVFEKHSPEITGIIVRCGANILADEAISGPCGYGFGHERHVMAEVKRDGFLIRIGAAVEIRPIPEKE